MKETDKAESTIDLIYIHLAICFVSTHFSIPIYALTIQIFIYLQVRSAKKSTQKPSSSKSLKNEFHSVFPFLFFLFLFSFGLFILWFIAFRGEGRVFLVIKTGRRVSTLYLDKCVCLCVCVCVCVRFWFICIKNPITVLT